MSGTRLVLIRHGESVAQAGGFIAGHDGCRGLSDLGRRQVEALRDRMASTGAVHADVFLTSLMARAIETAAILAPAIGRDATQLCDFCEIHPGQADGLTWDERDARFPPEPGWTWTPETVISPGGESWREFAARVARAIDAVVADHDGETIVIACHGGVVRGSLIHFLGVDLGASQQAMVRNASVTEWRVGANPDDGRTAWRLARWNDHAHLEGTDLLVES